VSHLEANKLDPRDRSAIEALITEFFDLLIVAQPSVWGNSSCGWRRESLGYRTRHKR